MEETYVAEICRLKHELLEQRMDSIEDKILGIEGRMTEMSDKIDNILKWQEDQYKLQIGLLVAIVLTLVGVFVGRAIDFGLFA